MLHKCLTNGDMKGGSCEDALTLISGKHSLTILKRVSLNSRTLSDGSSGLTMPHIQIYTKFAIFARLYFSYFTTLRHKRDFPTSRRFLEYFCHDFFGLNNIYIETSFENKMTGWV